VTTITHSVEIDRSPEDVFAYVEDLARHGEWQDTVFATTVTPEGPTGVGTRATETRKMGNREQTVTYEVTEHNPPQSFAFKGVDGPIRPIGRGNIESLDGGTRSRVTIELDFEGHGVGKFMLPLVRSQARKQVPKDQANLKQRLETA
jgi:uncharacterized protein YndB with AHSA1/START domain